MENIQRIKELVIRMRLDNENRVFNPKWKGFSMIIFSSNWTGLTRVCYNKTAVFSVILTILHYSLDNLLYEQVWLLIYYYWGDWAEKWKHFVLCVTVIYTMFFLWTARGCQQSPSCSLQNTTHGPNEAMLNYFSKKNTNVLRAVCVCLCVLLTRGTQMPPFSDGVQVWFS